MTHLLDMIKKRARQAVYKLTPLSKRPKPRDGEPYCERTMFIHSVDNGHICFECHTVKRTQCSINDKETLICPKCGSDDMRWVGPIARVPRKNASKKKWKDFFDIYCEQGHVKGSCR